ncbi:hypothetical protein SNK03_004378 [Fusarium graminearum]
MASMELTHNDYTVGWVCALPKEQTAALAMLDCEHPALPKQPTDKNAYTLGAVGEHNVVIACLPKGMYGTNSAATVAARMLNTFPSIKFGLLVGIGAGIPPQVRLGDVVVSSPIKRYPGVVQWDFGESVKGGDFKRIGALNNPPSELLAALTKVESKHDMTGSKIPEYLDEMAIKFPKLKTKYIKSNLLNDHLFSPPGVRDDSIGILAFLFPIWKTIVRVFTLLSGWQIFASESTVDGDSPEQTREMQVHYGLIASGNRLIKDSVLRDIINHQMDGHVLCLEMEAAGLASDFPCLVIRGICDYADSGKNKDWQEHAAAVATAFAKELLSEVQATEVSQMRDAKIILEMKASVDEISENVTHIQSALRNQKHQDILDWLSTIDYSSVQNDTIRRHQPGTCQWLLHSEKYQHWLKTRKQALFCQGIPGAGKTILTSVVINDIGQKRYEDSCIGIAYIYLNYREQDDQEIEKILESLVKQLAEQHASFPDVIEDLYTVHSVDKTRPSITELLETLQLIVEAYDRVYILFDALDECRTSGGRRSKLLKLVVDLKENYDVNLFMTSRYMSDIEEEFKGNIMKMEIRASEEDVGSYLDSRLPTISELVRKNKDLRDEIRIKMIDAVDGMFLLAELHAKSLEGIFLPNQIRDALAKLPTGTTAYDEAYRGTMNRIDSRVETREFAKMVLAWITCARRPLTTSELRFALAVQIGDVDLDESNVPEIGDVVAVCAGLVVVDKQSNIIRLAHYTIQQYLQRTQGDWFPNAETDITIACVTSLSHKTFQEGHWESWNSVSEKPQSNGFYDYVATNWGHHGRRSRTIRKELMEFLHSNRSVLAAAQALISTAKGLSLPLNYIVLEESRRNRGDVSSRSGHPRRKIIQRMENLHLTAYFGMVEAVSALLKDGKDPNVRDSVARTPLTWAAMNGYMATVKLLLEYGADADCRDIYGTTPLSTAAENGHASIVSLLLAIEGVDADSRDIYRRTPLSMAADMGHATVFNVMLSTNSVNINVESGNHQTPAFAAIQRGHVEIVRRLLGDKHFNVNSTNKYGETLLASAVKKGDEDIVRLLLAADEIQVNSGTIAGRTLLAHATLYRFYNIRKLLIDSGKVDVHITDQNIEGASRWSG